jgi:predicted nucleic acid-binding protein
MKKRTTKSGSPARVPSAPRPRVYLDSTIPSYYFDTRPEILNYVADTRHWWDKESSAYDLWVSQATLRELAPGEHPHRDEILEFVRKIKVLPEDRMVLELAQTYIDHKLMPASLEGDAAHLAYASFYGFNYLLTWNCNHLANANKRRHIEVINIRLGLASPLIVTPQMLVKEIKP